MKDTSSKSINKVVNYGNLNLHYIGFPPSRRKAKVLLISKSNTDGNRVEIELNGNEIAALKKLINTL
jgi:hypothetical protein